MSVSVRFTRLERIHVNGTLSKEVSSLEMDGDSPMKADVCSLEWGDSLMNADFWPRIFG